MSSSGGSQQGIYVTGADSVVVQDVQITSWGSGGSGIFASTKVFLASRCTVRGRYAFGIYVSNWSGDQPLTSAIDHVLVTGAYDTGIRVGGFGGTLGAANISTSYSTVDSCYTGVACDIYGNGPLYPRPSIRNCIISNSPSRAASSNNSNCDADYCDMWNSSATNGVALGSNVVSINPLYVNSNQSDYHLRSFSPCRILGEGGTELGRYGPNSGASGVGGPGPGSSALSLLPIYPNPLSRSGTIGFNLARASTVTIDVFDSLGRVVTSSQSAFEAGLQSFTFEAHAESGRPLPSGVYYYRVTAAGTSETGRLTVAR